MGGIAVTVSAILIISLLVAKHEFPIRIFPANVDIEITEFLWNYRLIDVMSQAFVLFIAAACCVALLRVEEKKNDST